MLLKEVSYSYLARLYLVNQKYSKNCEILLQFKIAIFYFKMSFIPVMAKKPLLQSSVPHDPSEIILICWFAQETFINFIDVEKSCAA